MSTLTGHFEITMQALNELKAEHNSWLIHAVPTRSQREEFTSGDIALFALASAPSDPANPAWGSVLRDVKDVWSAGHWLSDSAQTHHFMRKFDGQSPVEAYIDAIRWIRENAVQAARGVADRLRHLTPGKSVNPLSGQPSVYLGNSVHAVQDSFSRSHVIRERGVAGKPGRILHIKTYEGREKKGEGGKSHEHYDELWRKERKKKFSADGRYAVRATKELIWMALGSAMAGKGSPNAVELIGWERYRAKWLARSPRLSSHRNFAYDFIDRFRIGARLGSFMVTVNMDENGLADALVRERGENSGQVQEVFERLCEKHGSDSDDVARRYVAKVRQGGPALEALKGNPELIRLLVAVMEDGWTSDEEDVSIRYLRALVNPAFPP